MSSFDAANKAHNLVLTSNRLSSTERPYLHFYIFYGRTDLIQSLLACDFILLLQ